MSVKPLTPEEERKVREGSFPDWIFEAVNTLIIRNMRGNQEFSIRQREIMTEALNLAPDGTTSQKIYDNGWMDFEPMYRSHGWEVKYKSPAMDESWDAYFTFKPVPETVVNHGL